MQKYLPIFFGAFPFLFVGGWVFVSWLIAKMGGWSRLAEAYRCTNAFEGSSFRCQSGGVGKASYSNILTVGGDNDGLYLALLFLFRPFHPPLYIPWSEIAMEAKEEKALFFRYRCVILTFASAPGVTLKLKAKLLEKLLKRIPDSAKYEQ